MNGLSIRKRILAITLGLIVLMAVTSILSTWMASKIAHQLEELTTKYVEAYGSLARMNIRSLEQALALRRMVIAKMQSPPDEAGFAERQKIFNEKSSEVDKEADAARKLINAIIADVTTDSDNAGLARIENRIETANKDLKRYLSAENKTLLAQFETRDFPEIRRSLARIDTLRDDFNQTIEAIRVDTLSHVRKDAMVTMRDQHQAILISGILTGLAAILGLLFSYFVSSGIIRPVRRLLAGTRAVEQGQLDGLIDITTRDEIGQLTAAFNGMVEQLRNKEKMRETFGRYIDPARRGRADRPAEPDRHRRSAPCDDGVVLRHEGIHEPQRGHNAARSRQGYEPLFDDDVGTYPQSPGNPRQIHWRCDHGLLGTSLR